MTDSDSHADLTFSLTDKVAVVTGGASGIGAAIGRAFVAKGARVAVADLALDAAEATVAQLGNGCAAFACDVSDPAAVTATVQAVLEHYGRIDILVNCAGIGPLAAAEDLSLDVWDATMDVNLKGTFLMSQTVGRAMLAQGRGKIINLASQAATVALDGHLVLRFEVRRRRSHEGSGLGVGWSRHHRQHDLADRRHDRPRTPDVGRGQR